MSFVFFLVEKLKFIRSNCYDENVINSIYYTIFLFYVTVGKYGYHLWMWVHFYPYIHTIFPKARQTAPTATSGFALLARTQVLPIYLGLHAGRVSGLYFRNKWSTQI